MPPEPDGGWCWTGETQLDLTADVHARTGPAWHATDPHRTSRAADQAGLDTVIEEDGVLAAWFDRHGCQAAIVRPDHYVFGVASDDRALGTMLSDLAIRLQ